MTKLKNYKPTKFMAEGSHYDKNLADYAVNFIECLCHTKGTWAGKPFKLLDWQERIIRDLFGIIKSNGYRQFNTAYIEIPKKNGKELSLDTLIPTPDGFTTMGEIQVGDTVFDENGNPCHVIAKSRIDFEEQAYRITFKDGEVIEPHFRFVRSAVCLFIRLQEEKRNVSVLLPAVSSGGMLIRMQSDKKQCIITPVPDAEKPSPLMETLTENTVPMSAILKTATRRMMHHEE